MFSQNKENSPTLNPFQGGWHQHFLHILFNIVYVIDLVLFGCPSPCVASSMQNAYLLITITNSLYFSRKEFIIICNKPPITNFYRLFYIYIDHITKVLITRAVHFLQCIIRQNEQHTAAIFNGELVNPGSSK